MIRFMAALPLLVVTRDSRNSWCIDMETEWFQNIGERCGREGGGREGGRKKRQGACRVAGRRKWGGRRRRRRGEIGCPLSAFVYSGFQNQTKLFSQQRAL